MIRRPCLLLSAAVTPEEGRRLYLEGNAGAGTSRELGDK